MHGSVLNNEEGEFSYSDLESLSYQLSKNSPASSSPKSGFGIIQGSVIVLGALSVLLFVAYDGSLVDSGLSLISQDVLAQRSDISIVASNEYGIFSGQYPFFSDYPGSQLIEPFKQTTITLQGSMVQSGLYSFQWQLDDSPPSAVSEGAASVVLSVSSVGLFPLSVHVFSLLSGQYVGTFKTTLISRYVKRELRSITSADRDRFLAAAHTIWEYSTEEGRELFGDKFTGIHTFVKEHATASEDIMCDQFHEGSGFLTHHLALGNSFEAALRSVDASVTLPYWDFSIEGQAIVGEGETPSYLMKITPVFSDEWFGEIDENNHISSSLWAHTLMPAVSEHDDADITPHNSYGYFRSYWNNNPDPEVVRHMFDVCGLEDEQKKVPSCSAHFQVMNSSTLADFQTSAPGDGHGPMHVQMGGVFGGCSVAYLKFNEKWGSYLDTNITSEEVQAGGLNVTTFMNKWGDSNQRRAMFSTAVMGEYFHIYRGLWRSHMCAVDGTQGALKCPEKCDVSPSDEGEGCRCSVTALEEGSMDWSNLYPCLLNEDNRAFFSGVMSEQFLRETVQLVAGSSVKEGEMLHSGSPSDIMFWMIHPVIERLLAAKRVRGVTSMGGTPFVKWGTDQEERSDSWLSYSYYNLEEGQNLYHPEAYTCVGHSASDPALPSRLPYTDAILTGGADRDGDGQISNWEFFQALDPNNLLANDYLFDNFKWPHCEGKL